jgi:hypothetical protein
MPRYFFDSSEGKLNLSSRVHSLEAVIADNIEDHLTPQPSRAATAFSA